MKKKISSKKAPAAIGPYSQGIETEHLIFLSGQIPLDPETMQLVEGDENQIRQVFKNIDALCTEANLNMDHIVKLNVSLHDLSLFSLVNEIMKPNIINGLDLPFSSFLSLFFEEDKFLSFFL